MVLFLYQEEYDPGGDEPQGHSPTAMDVAIMAALPKGVMAIVGILLPFRHIERRSSFFHRSMSR